VIIGYARVSTAEQHLDLQLDALRAAGCEKIYEDHTSGVATERPGWAQARAALRAGDTLVVWRLDRLGRSLKHLIDTIGDLNDAGIAFKSLTENLDTSSTGGKLVFHIFGALAEFERELIRERTLAGLAAARARGRKGGRPRKLDARKIATARRMLEDPNQTVTEVAEILGVARSTLYRALKQAPNNRRA
jgi:DNA invertase Pin-like site-specific DNA recombinase